MGKRIIWFAIGFIIGGIGGYSYVKDKVTKIDENKVVEKVADATSNYADSIKKAFK